MARDRKKYICSKCGYEHYFSKKVTEQFGCFICQKCGFTNKVE